MRTLYSLSLAVLVIFLILPVSNAQPWMSDFDPEGKAPDFYSVQEAFNLYWEGKTHQRGDGWKQFKRWEWFMETRVDSAGYYNPLDLWNGWLEKRELFPGDELDEADWTSMGPFLTRESYVGGLGRINCISFDPVDPDIIYICASSGGLWKTTDHGDNWTNLTDYLPLLGTTGLVVDPEDTDVIYLATGDGDGTDTYSIGVLKSLDGGDTWNTTGLSWNVTDYQLITRIVMHPDNPAILLASTHGGIYRTSDNGDTWVETLDGTNFKDLEVNPEDGNIWYASRAGFGIYKSTDGGTNWVRLTNGLPTTGYARIAICISPANTDVLYALYATTNSRFYGLYRSTNAGENWSLRANTPNILGYSNTGDDNSGQAWYDLTIAADPDDQDVVYTGGINIWKSTDGGADLEILTHWTGDRAAFVHADQHALEFNGDVLYAGHDGGINYSTDFGDIWTDITDGLVITQIYRLGILNAGREVSRAMNGNQDNGSNYCNNETWASEIGGDGMECAIDPANPDFMYGEYYFGSMMRTTDGGRNWSSSNQGTNNNEGAWVTPFLIDPNHPMTMYKATTRIYRTLNRAERWNDISGSFNGNTMRSLAIAPSNSEIIYTADIQGNLYHTSNAGDNWTRSTSPRERVTYLAFDPQDENTLFATVGGYASGQKVFVSSDEGENWTNLSMGLPNLPANCIVVHPGNSDHLYLGMDVGVYFSDNGGLTWMDYSAGMPNVIVNEIELHVPSNTLVACTYGRGMWQSPAETADDNPSIRIYSPSGGEQWNMPSTHFITWYDNIEGEVLIELMRSEEVTDTIAESTPSDGIHNWYVSEDILPGVGYSIRITSIDDPDISAESAETFEFIIQPPTLQFPDNYSQVTYFPVLLMWTTSSGAESYRLQIATSNLFGDNSIVVDDTLSETMIQIAELGNGTRYYWRVKALDGFGGESRWSEIWVFLLVVEVSEKEFVGVPAEYGIASVYPNPFNSSSAVIVGLPEMQRLKVQLYNIKGELIETLASGPFPPGYHRFTINGAELSSGTYFINAVVDGKLDEHKKIILLK